MRQGFKRSLGMIAMAVLMLVQAVPVSAEEYSTEGTADCEVSCRVASTYTVSIPAAVSLAYSTETGTARGTYKVGVKGELLLDQMVVVKPVKLTGDLAAGINGDFLWGTLVGEDTGKSLSVTVNQKITQWVPAGTEPYFGAESCVDIAADDFVYADGTITTGELEVSDYYTGTLVFAFGLEEYDRRQ